MNALKITLNDDGSISINATGMKGSAASIEGELRALAKSVGGDLTIEKHVHGAHAHTHGDGTYHTHN